jgi:hypothetical protein
MQRETSRLRLDGELPAPSRPGRRADKTRDEASINEIPFNVNALEGELSFGVNLTARPVFTFGIQVLGGAVATLDAGFEIDLPRVYAKATAVSS